MSNKEKKIGIVGLGVMGKPMAKNLLTLLYLTSRKNLFRNLSD